jgi:hypothetical protein
VLDGDATEVEILGPSNPVVAPNGEIFFTDRYGIRIYSPRGRTIETLGPDYRFTTSEGQEIRLGMVNELAVAISKTGDIFVAGTNRGQDVPLMVWQIARKEGRGWTARKVAGGGKANPSDGLIHKATDVNLGDNWLSMLPLRNGDLLLSSDEYGFLTLSPIGDGRYSVGRLTPKLPDEEADEDWTFRVNALAEDTDGSVVISGNLEDHGGRGLYRLSRQGDRLTSICSRLSGHVFDSTPESVAVAPGGGIFAGSIYQHESIVFVAPRGKSDATLRGIIDEAQHAAATGDMSRFNRIRASLERITQLPNTSGPNFIAEVTTVVDPVTGEKKKVPSHLDALPRDIRQHLRQFLGINDRRYWTTKIRAAMAIKELDRRIAKSQEEALIAEQAREEEDWFAEQDLFAKSN